MKIARIAFLLFSLALASCSEQLDMISPDVPVSATGGGGGQNDPCKSNCE